MVSDDPTRLQRSDCCGCALRCARCGAEHDRELYERDRAELARLRAKIAAADALREAAAEYYEAVTMNLGPCTIPVHNGEPCYECYTAGTQAAAEHKAASRLADLLGIRRSHGE